MKNEWKTKRLGDVCEIIKGRKPTLKSTPESGDLPYLGAKVMRGSAEAEYASVKDRNSVVVEESETIIICDGSNSGEVFTGFRGILSSTMGKISKKAEIDDHYLRAFLASTFEVFNGAKTGAAIPHLDKEAMYQLPFPFPPLPEQQRIAGLLDEALAGIGTAKVNTDKNLQNARALFESHLQFIFTQRGKAWVETALGDVCAFVRGPFGGSLKKSIFVADGYAVYEQQHAIDNQFDDVRYFIDEAKFKEMKRFELLPDDLIMSCSGTMGRVAIVPKDIRRGIINQALLKLTPSPKIVNAFLKLWMESEAFQDSLKEYSGGAAIQNVASVKILKEIKVPLPSMSEQKRVVEELDELREETERLATLYERKLVALQALKKSLLHQAFTGKLLVH